MRPNVGQVINSKYRLSRHIGDGGMGSVFEARHETLGTTVALKFLHLEFTRKQGIVQRFVQEARASAQIHGAHVVRVFDVDQTSEGDVFIVMEHLEGKTLQALYEELYRAGRRLSYSDALDYATQVLDGVDAAHRAGVVHRDLKPDNVMITTDDKGGTLLKLLDFGIAKIKVIGDAPGLTRPGVMMGTPEYMAPEQTSSAGSVDARADVFSLGVMVFEMLAGQRPVGGDDPYVLAEAHRAGRISKLVDLVPGIAPALASAVHRAMALKPEDRFASAGEFQEAIEGFAAAVRPPSPSRARAGGTIGVSVSGVPAPVAPRAQAPVPKPSSGVAKTWPPEDAPAAPKVSKTLDDEAGPPPAPVGASGTQVPGVAREATQEMTQPYPFAGGVAPAPAPRLHGRRRRRGTPLAAIVVGALALAGLVTGGVYLATRSSSSDDDDTPPKPTAEPPPPVTVSRQEPPPPPPPFVPAPTPTPAPRPVSPAPKPSGSAVPTAEPVPFILPSVLPFPNPFEPAPQPQPAPTST